MPLGSVYLSVVLCSNFKKIKKRFWHSKSAFCSGQNFHNLLEPINRYETDKFARAENYLIPNVADDISASQANLCMQTPLVTHGAQNISSGHSRQVCTLKHCPCA